MSEMITTRPTVAQAVLRTRTGERLPIDTARWSAAADGHEASLLRELAGPVLDVGCGPGRLVARLLHLGTPALGLDPAPRAVALAQRRGAPVLQRSVWEPLPGEGRWASILLFDGNIGIGGDPAALLRRCRNLLAPGGQILMEVAGPEVVGRSLDVRLERGERVSAWFRWATVGVAGLADLAAVAGLAVEQLGHTGDGTGPDRWFAWLRPA